MGGRGSASINEKRQSPLQSQYQDALKIAKQKVDAQERAETERLQRISVIHPINKNREKCITSAFFVKI